MSKAKLALAALAFLICAFAGQPAQAAAGRAECQSVRSKILARSVAYCALLPPSYDVEKTRRYPVLYFLHGLGDNEQMFLHSGGWNLVEDLWEQHQLGEFVIVTPAAGASFYINSHDGKAAIRRFFSARVHACHRSPLPDYRRARDARHCGLFDGRIRGVAACVLAP